MWVFLFFQIVFVVIFYNHEGHSCLNGSGNNIKLMLHVKPKMIGLDVFARPKMLGFGLFSRPNYLGSGDCQTQGIWVWVGFIEKKENIILIKNNMNT